jgi:aryl-alcohol dehydrogenase-like predicted oxidoreductase
VIDLRPLGRGGPPVSPIGLGLAALGRPGYLNLGHSADLGERRSPDDLRARTAEVLDAAYAGGVRYFDAARSYGRAEEFLAAWLDDRAPTDVTIGSKWGYTYTADWQIDADPPEVKELTLPTLRRQLDETRTLLGDRLALYQIHSATVSSGVLDDREVLDELARLRDDGVRIGFTTSGTDQAATIRRALEVGGFDAVQSTWNLHERSAEAALAEAHDAGLGVIVKEALANGRLTDRQGDERLTAVAREAGATSDAVALAAVLAQPWVDVVLSGAATVDTLRSNLVALDVDPAVARDPRLDALREEPDTYWGHRSDLRWT